MFLPLQVPFFQNNSNNTYFQITKKNGSEISLHVHLKFLGKTILAMYRNLFYKSDLLDCIVAASNDTNNAFCISDKTK